MTYTNDNEADDNEADGNEADGNEADGNEAERRGIGSNNRIHRREFLSTTVAEMW